MGLLMTLCWLALAVITDINRPLQTPRSIWPQNMRQGTGVIRFAAHSAYTLQIYLMPVILKHLCVCQTRTEWTQERKTARDALQNKRTDSEGQMKPLTLTVRAHYSNNLSYFCADIAAVRPSPDGSEGGGINWGNKYASYKSRLVCCLYIKGKRKEGISAESEIAPCTVFKCP